MVRGRLDLEFIWLGLYLLLYEVDAALGRLVPIFESFAFVCYNSLDVHGSEAGGPVHLTFCGGCELNDGGGVD